MSDTRLALRRLATKVLSSGGTAPLALFLEAFLTTGELRELAKKFALSPKGFRVEKAPAHVLAPLLGETKDAAQLDEVMERLTRRAAPAAAVDPKAAESGDPAALEGARTETKAVRRDLERVEAEHGRTREQLQKALQGRTRAQERESELRRQVERLEEQGRLLHSELERLRKGSGGRSTASAAKVEGLHQELYDLRQERLGLVETDEALRRQLAVYLSRIRGLEEAVKELEALVPKGKGKRRRKVVEMPPLEADKRVLVPRFTDQFYRSLQDKERKAVERALHAIFQFCTEGHAYPGLEVKQLRGQDTWSLRASLGLRVYFRQLGDGVVEFLELGNREDQNTTLRRLKDRG